VFVSGPADIEAEKAALRTIVADLSELLEKSHGVALRLIGWPDTVLPGVGVDPQSVINRQIASEFDIYVGVIGSRFGQRTARAASGTEEEFASALARFKADTTAVRVLFYFKRSAQDPFTLDPDQLRKVREFREGIGAQGVLYKDFNDTAQFSDIIRKHLHHLVVDEWKDGRWTAIEINQTAVIPAESNKNVQPAEPTVLPRPSSDTGERDDDELGYLELLEELQRASEAATEILGRITDHTVSIGKNFSKRSQEVNELLVKQQEVERIGGRRLKQQFISQAKELVNKAAADLQSYAASMTTDLPKFKAENRAIFQTFRLSVLLQEELDTSVERLQEERAALVKLLDVLTTSRGQVIGLQSTIVRMPALTSALKKARKRASASLGEFIAELQFSIEQGGEILGQLPG